MDFEKLEKQLEFIIEVDKLKTIYRQTLLMDKSRYENDAEHSWHLALMAFLLSEYASDKDLDLLKVVKMVLIHDIVEIDAGDTFCYDVKGYEDKNEREEKAADRIFGLLPEEQENELKAIWREFEEMQTPEAKYAASLDRFQPLLHNYRTQGAAWQKHGVTSDKVINRNQHIQNGAPVLWEYAKKMIDESVDKGYLSK